MKIKIGKMSIASACWHVSVSLNPGFNSNNTFLLMPCCWHGTQYYRYIFEHESKTNEMTKSQVKWIQMKLLTFWKRINEIGGGEEGLIGFFDIVVRHIIVIVHVINGTLSIAVPIIVFFFKLQFIVLFEPTVDACDLIWFFVCFNFQFILIFNLF